VSRARPLYGWLTAEAVSLTGTRVSMVAIPWLVLTTTGSATLTGLIAFAEMAPYVLAKAASGPMIDRIGPRKVSIGADLGSVGLVGGIPVLHLSGVLSFPLLLVLVALAGLLRGPGDGAKTALVPAIVAAAAVPIERATGLAGAVERLATTLGTATAGVLVAVVGPAQALIIDAASFGVSALALFLSAPRPSGLDQVEKGDPGYLQRMREGWTFLRHDRILVGIVAMVAATNLLDAAWSAVLVPVWARETGGGATAVGLLFAVFAAGSVGGALVAAATGERLPRFTTYVIGFAVGGLPRFVVMILDTPMALVLAVAVVSGFANGFVNPIIGAVTYERVPDRLMGRVTTLKSSLCWSTIPFGGLLGGALIAGIGFTPAMLAVGLAYLAATMLPALQPRWREIDRRPRTHREPAAVTSRGTRA
jgi:MFS family permease